MAYLNMTMATSLELPQEVFCDVRERTEHRASNWYGYHVTRTACGVLRTTSSVLLL